MRTFLALLAAAALLVLAEPMRSNAAPSLTLPALHVTPRTVTDGDTVTVSSSGCVAGPATADPPAVHVTLDVEFEVDSSVAETTTDAHGSAGAWSTTLTVPRDAGFGSDFSVNAECEHLGEAGEGYAGVGLSVIASHPTAYVWPDSVIAWGATSTIYAGGFAPGEQLEIRLRSQVLVRAAADRIGDLTAEVVMPRTTPLGDRRFIVVGLSSGARVGVHVIVVAEEGDCTGPACPPPSSPPPPALPPPPATPPPLASTGSATSDLTSWALVLLVAGVALSIVGTPAMLGRCTRARSSRGSATRAGASSRRT